MMINMAAVILAVASSPEKGGQTTAPFFLQMFPILLVFVVFYFALIRPQQKKAKEHEQMLKTIKAGDKVLVSGGIVAVISGVKEKTVTVRSADAKFEVLKSAVTDITERASSSSES